MSLLQELVNLVRDGDLKSVESFISNHEVDLNQVNRTGISPLMVACTNGHVEIAKLLLKKGAKVNFVNDLNQNALMKAAEGGNVEVVNLLVEHGANCNTAAIDTKTALTLACEQGSVEVVEALLPNTEFKETKGTLYGIPGLGSEWKFSYTLSPVFIAVKNGHTQLVKWLLRGNKVPLGALFQAISQRNHDMVKVLLQNGANVNETGERGWTALMQASFLGDSAIVSTLLDSEKKSKRKRRRVYRRRRKRSSKNVIIDHRDEGKFSALMLAARYKHAEVVTLLLKAGAKVNLKGYGGKTALLWAMDPFGIQDPDPHSSVKAVKALLDGGADVNLKEDDGRTPLLFAVDMGICQWRLEVIELLLNKKAVTDHKNSKGKTVLNKKVVIDHKNSKGNYALKSAVFKCDIAVARLLLEGGAKTDMKDGEGKSLLMDVRDHIFKTSTAVQMTKLLLDYGVPIGIRDNEGKDALLHAVTSPARDYEVIELLLERGADATLKPDHGSNAKGFLQQNITHVLVSLLAKKENWKFLYV